MKNKLRNYQECGETHYECQGLLFSLATLRAAEMKTALEVNSKNISVSKYILPLLSWGDRCLADNISSTYPQV